MDVRILTASNRNLEDEVKNGNFRKDLFYRIHVIPVNLPSLRERKEDIPLLVDHFLKKFSDEMNRSAKELSMAAMQYLINATLNIGQSRDDQAVYTIELAEHRLNRYKELRSLAEQAADQVRQTQTEFVTPALSAAERRMVHTILQDEPDLETFSRGQEPDRRLVVRLQSAEAEAPEED